MGPMSLVLRNLLVVFALVGLFGQSTVRAMPMQTLAAEPATSAEAMTAEHCADMAEPVAAGSPDAPAEKPCKPMTGDCVGEMGCALSVAQPTRATAGFVPVRYEAIVYDRSDEAHPGLSVTPELFPPIKLG